MGDRSSIYFCKAHGEIVQCICLFITKSKPLWQMYWYNRKCQFYSWSLLYECWLRSAPRYTFRYLCCTLWWILISYVSVAHLIFNTRGSFRKFCYERLRVCKKRIYITDFMYTYSSFYYTATCEIPKQSSKYQHCYWHPKMPQSYTLAIIWGWKGRKRCDRSC